MSDLAERASLTTEDNSETRAAQSPLVAEGKTHRTIPGKTKPALGIHTPEAVDIG